MFDLIVLDCMQLNSTQGPVKETYVFDCCLHDSGFLFTCCVHLHDYLHPQLRIWASYVCYVSPLHQADVCYVSPFHQADDSGDLQESPYIGRARFRANQFAHESSGGMSPSPQRASILHSSRRSSSLHSPGGGGILRRSLSPPSKAQAQAELDAQLEQKHAEVQKSKLIWSGFCGLNMTF